MRRPIDGALQKTRKMSFFAVILIFLLIFFVIIPIFRVGAAIYRARRQTRQFFDSLGRNAAGNRSDETPATPKPKKKKIDPTDGEYVQFEEIDSTTTVNSSTDSAGRTSTTVETEQQIVDIEWEDIK